MRGVDDGQGGFTRSGCADSRGVGPEGVNDAVGQGQAVRFRILGEQLRDGGVVPAVARLGLLRSHDVSGIGYHLHHGRQVGHEAGIKAKQITVITDWFQCRRHGNRY